jgi:hypothetical protein
MPVSRLLKSWAIPPARVPMASIFWDLVSCFRSRDLSASASLRP